MVCVIRIRICEHFSQAVGIPKIAGTSLYDMDTPFLWLARDLDGTMIQVFRAVVNVFMKKGNSNIWVT